MLVLAQTSQKIFEEKKLQNFSFLMEKRILAL
jgi:hypothetical protein